MSLKIGHAGDGIRTRDFQMPQDERLLRVPYESGALTD